MNGLASFWPPNGSAYATQIDVLMWSFTLVTALLAGPVVVLIIAFAVRYRRGREADRTHPTDRSVGIEVSWSVLPFLLTIGFFIYAAWLFIGLQRPPSGAMTINVVAKQWMWKFQHPEGQVEINDLHVPAGQPVALVMTSQDVIHSLYLPVLRIKQDVLPGRYTRLWFKADKPGIYRLHCAEFCGADHSVMGGVFTVLSPADYARWLARSQTDLSLAAQGEALYRRLGCSGCHGAGSVIRAPRLSGVAGSPVPLADGRVVVADAQYLRDSILEPNKDIVAGFEPRMPTFGNQVDESQVAALVAYLQSLATEQRR